MSDKSHVIHDRETDTLQCRHCLHRREIEHWRVSRPLALLEFKDEFAEEHKGCAEYADNPHLAAISFKAKLALKQARYRKRKPLRSAAA